MSESGVDFTQQNSGDVTVVRVATKIAKSHFLNLPVMLHRKDPNWIAPLRMVEAERLNSKKHPFYEHGDAAFWVAYRCGRPAGRISAQVDQLHLNLYQDATGYFGMFESVNDQEVVDALVGAAADWLTAQDLKRVIGPFCLSINEESGLLVKGFEHPPAIMTDHALPYYGTLLETAGFIKAKDLFSFKFRFNDVVPDAFWRVGEALERFPDIVLRKPDRRRLVEDFRTAIDIFNDAWSENWNFVPFTEAETLHLIKGVKPFIKPDHMWLAEENGRPIAVVAAIPDLNEASRGLNGRLLPFGWLKFLWRAKVAGVKGARLTLLGIRKEFQSSAKAAIVTAALMLRIRQSGLDNGLEHAEISWVLEDNHRLLRIAAHGGLQQEKTFRIYERELGASLR